MTKEEIAVLGHAFFDGKTLQYKPEVVWIDWSLGHCPNFNQGYEWRIKPDEPKTITICTFNGSVHQAVTGSMMWGKLATNPNWTHVKSLDQVVEME